MTNTLKFAWCTGLLAILFTARVMAGSPSTPQRSNASPIPDRVAIAAILGEAANQPADAMLGVACAIRNRGTLQGVYGLANHRAQDCPARIRDRARRAWRESANPATLQHFNALTGSSKFFGCAADAPYFRRVLRLRPVLTLGQITFYSPPRS